MGSSYLRFAAGVCLLSTGLFLGATGGAIAVADTDSGGSTSDAGGGADGSSPDSNTTSSPAGNTATNPIGSIADTLSRKLQRVTSTFGPGATADQQPSTSAESSTGEAGGTDTETNDSDLVAAEPSPAEPVPTVVEPVTSVVEPDPSVVAPVPSVVEPLPTVDPLVTTGLAPVSGPAMPVANVVAPIPVLITQATDVVAALEDMLTSVAGGVVAFTQPLQSDLFSLLGVTAVGPALGGVGGHDGPMLSTAAGASVLAPPMVSPLSMVLPRAGIPSTGNATEVAPLAGLATTLLSQESSLPAQAPSRPDGVIPPGVRKFFQQVFDELRRSPALAVLAATALPGVGGLLIVTAAGVRLGYRQAKAGLALHTAGIARFARSGPIGVVRSGSLIGVRPRRPSHVIRSRPLHAGSVVDEAA